MDFSFKFLIHAKKKGHQRLVNAVAALYSKFIGREIDPNSEVIVTLGAMESIFAAILTNVDDGDEVIIIEPFFDCYDPIIQMAGGITRSVPLKLVSQIEEFFQPSRKMIKNTG